MMKPEADNKAVAIEMWYDPHIRLWVLYPVDKEGNQLEDATFVCGKKEALKVKKVTH